MRIEAIRNTQNTLTMRSVYFSRSGWVFLKDKSGWAGETTGTTERGIKYLIDTKIPDNIKSRFMQIPFIQSLSGKNEVFIHYNEVPKGSSIALGDKIMSTAKIIWTDYTKAFADVIYAGGVSTESQEDATEQLLKNIEKKNVSGDVPSLQKIYLW